MSTASIGATRACSLAVTALLTHKLEGSGIAKQAQAYLTAGGSCLRDSINLAGWGRTAQEVESMSDFYRLKKKQNGFGVGTFRILDLSTPTSVIKNICRTWGVQMVSDVLELIQQRIDQVSTDSSLQDKLNALQPAGDVKAGTLLANNAARLKEELHRIDAVVKRMGREQEPTLSAPTAGGTCPLQVAGIPRAIQVVRAPATPEDDDDEPEIIETRGSNKRARPSSTLRDRRDEEQAAALKKVKEENSEAQELADQLVLSENNKMSEIDELKRAVSERDSRIEALEAEAREKDATIAELRGRMGQLDNASRRSMRSGTGRSCEGLIT